MMRETERHFLETVAKVCWVMGTLNIQSLDWEDMWEDAVQIVRDWIDEINITSPEEKGYIMPYALRILKENYKSANEVKDNVNNPSHYTQGNIEAIDAIESAVSELKGIEAFCTGNAIKYLWRWKQKNGVEDLHKAEWYLQKLIKREWKEHVGRALGNNGE